LFEIAEARDVVGATSRSREDGQDQAGKQGDDGDDHQDLDQGESELEWDGRLPM
jgi:hypothetical protein